MSLAELDIWLRPDWPFSDSHFRRRLKGLVKRSQDSLEEKSCDGAGRHPFARRRLCIRRVS